MVYDDFIVGSLNTKSFYHDLKATFVSVSKPRIVFFGGILHVFIQSKFTVKYLNDISGDSKKLDSRVK